MNRRGLTLLETMVALVILGLVIVGFLDVFGRALHAADDSRVWSQAVTYAEDGMERFKLYGAARSVAGWEQLGGDFSRRIETAPWNDGLVRVSLVVTLPGGGRYRLDRLVAAR